MTHSRIFILLAVSLMLAACAETPIPPLILKEKLAGKSPEDRQELLGLTCLNEAQEMNAKWKQTRHGGTYLTDDSDFNRSKLLCLRMTVAYLSPDAKKHAVLAQQCNERISTALHSNNATTAKHARRMQEVCEEMTGQKINDNINNIPN